MEDPEATQAGGLPRPAPPMDPQAPLLAQCADELIPAQRGCCRQARQVAVVQHLEMVTGHRRQAPRANSSLTCRRSLRRRASPVAARPVKAETFGKLEAHRCSARQVARRVPAAARDSRVHRLGGQRRSSHACRTCRYRHRRFRRAGNTADNCGRVARQRPAKPLSAQRSVPDTS